MDRQPFPQRRFLVRGQSQLDAVMAAARNLPIDPDKPIEVLIREEVKPRKLSQNALYWAGPLSDISAQAYVEGKLYTAEVWHEHLKEMFLPEVYDEDMCRPGYAKWAIKPNGNRICIGSTGDLTVKGFALYLTQVEAFGANLGVVYGGRQ